MDAKICSDAPCEQPSKTRGMCKKHYSRWIKRTPHELRPIAPRYSGELLNTGRASSVFDLAKPDIAYLFGFLQTDGSHHKGPGQKGKITLELNVTDLELLREFQRIIPYHTSIATRQRATNFAASSSTATLTLSSLEARNRLHELGLPSGKKSAIIAPPRSPFRRPDYLRGIIDADGSVGFTAKDYPFISVTTASAAMADHFCREVFDVTGARRSANRNRRDGVYNLMIAMEPAAEMAEWMYYNGCLALERKRSRAVAVAHWTRPATMRARSSQKRWTAAEDAVVLRMSVVEAALTLGRTQQSVNVRRWRLRNGKA